MTDYPKDLLEFRDQFGSEDACRDYLIQLRWPQGWTCSKCGSRKFWKMKRGVLCCQGCQRYISVTAGTLFADTHKPLRLWFEAIWHVTSQKYGASALGLQRILSFGSYHTAWNWLHKLRRAMVRPGRDRLAGIVEVDEIFIGGERSGKRGRGAAGKSLIVIVAQEAGKGIGRIRLTRVASASGDNLCPAVTQAVDSGSTVHTDGWKGYNGLKKLGYKHEVIRPTPALGENLLPLANRVASLLKRWLLVVGDAPGIRATESLGLLSGRIHVPIQSAYFRFARVVVLPTCGSSGAFATGADPRIEGRSENYFGRISLQASSA